MITLPIASCFGLQFSWGGGSCLAMLAFLQDLVCACCLQTNSSGRKGRFSLCGPAHHPPKYQ